MDNQSIKPSSIIVDSILTLIAKYVNLIFGWNSTACLPGRKPEDRAAFIYRASRPSGPLAG